MIHVVIWTLSLLQPLHADTGQIRTIAGGSVGDNGLATEANLGPQGIFVDEREDVYIADWLYSRIRKVDAETGMIVSMAGNGEERYAGDGGPSTEASLDRPLAVFVRGGMIYFVERLRIRRVGLDGLITTIAGNGERGFSGDGGPATETGLDGPEDLYVDSVGNVYIADGGFFNPRILKVDAESGVISSIVGTRDSGFSGDGGQASEAVLDRSTSLYVTSDGSIYITDAGNQRVRRVAPSGIISTIAGTGERGFSGDGAAATDAMLSSPGGLFVDAEGNVFFTVVGDRVRRIDAATGVISTVAGNGQQSFSGDGIQATETSLWGPNDVFLNPAGDIYISDNFNGRIRKVDVETGLISTVAGNPDLTLAGDDGPATDARLKTPTGTFVDGKGDLYIADTGNQRVRVISAQTGRISTVAGSGPTGQENGSFSGDDGLATEATFFGPEDIHICTLGHLYIADALNHRVRRVDVETGLISTVAGSGPTEFGSGSFAGDGGPATEARLDGVFGVHVDDDHNLFIADLGNSRIRRVDGSSGVIQTVAGNGQREFSGDGGLATEAGLSLSGDVHVDSGGNLYIVDGNNRIRKVDAATGIITTVAGSSSFTEGDGGLATETRLDSPIGVSVDGSGNVFIAEWGDDRIRVVDTVTGVISTVAGDGNSEFYGDAGAATDASLDRPSDVFIDHAGI